MKIIYPTITSVQYIETVRQYKEQAGQVYDARYHQCKTKSKILKNISFVSIFICCIVNLLNLRWHLFPSLLYSFITIGCYVIATMLVIWNPWEEPEYEYTRKEQEQLEEFEKDCIGVADQQKYQRTVQLLQKLEQLKEQHVVHSAIGRQSMTVNCSFSRRTEKQSAWNCRFPIQK